MSNDHQNICMAMKLITYKANEVIVKQGDKGDSFFQILSGVVKIIVSKKIDLGMDSTNSNVSVDVSFK